MLTGICRIRLPCNARRPFSRTRCSIQCLLKALLAYRKSKKIGGAESSVIAITLCTLYTVSRDEWVSNQAQRFRILLGAIRNLIKKANPSDCLAQP